MSKFDGGTFTATFYYIYVLTVIVTNYKSHVWVGSLFCIVFVLTSLMSLPPKVTLASQYCDKLRDSATDIGKTYQKGAPSENNQYKRSERHCQMGLDPPLVHYWCK